MYALPPPWLKMEVGLNEFDAILADLSALQNEVDSWVIDVAERFSPEIVDMNRDQQYTLGIDSRGATLKPYTNFTVRIKQFKRQPWDRTTLRDTEAFQRAFFVERRGDELIVYSRDAKTGALVKKYGEYIFGLTDQNKQNLIELVKPRLVELVRRKVLS